MILYSIIGAAAGAALMLAFRQSPFSLFAVPVCVAIGPLLLAWRGTKPSGMFLLLYILLTGLLFTAIALTGSGFLERFDPP